MDLILGTGVLQTANRNMRVSIGDILTYMRAANSSTPTVSYLEQLCRTVYHPVKFDRLIQERLTPTFKTSTVYCWLFQNITELIAQRLHTELKTAESYLGAMDIDFSKPLHLTFFRNELIEAYRLNGLKCTVFFEMNSNQGTDIVVKEGFESHGFSVADEDKGARGTIFDKYDTVEHFKRVESFKSIFSKLPSLNEDIASELAHSLEELHPKLFDALAAAARTLERAETEEDFAQAALSGRRLLEKIADYLFAPQSTDWNGRKVGKKQYKNRLWAYIEKAITSKGSTNKILLERLGKEADRLIDLFNSGLHADPPREKVELAFRDLVIWLADILKIDPTAARAPYLAYEAELQKFFSSVLHSDDTDKEE